jgi:hypothetical protein
MYDALTARYTFACPARGEARVPLSAFRRVERLPGAAHPALFRITFACACGGDHVGLVAHDELDWAPLGLETGSYVNVMTARVDDVAGELADRPRAGRSGGGRGRSTRYPGSAAPGFPSAFTLSPGERARRRAVLRHRARLSINLVSVAHLDVPFLATATWGWWALLLGRRAADGRVLAPTVPGLRRAACCWIGRRVPGDGR